jgi:CheY-like chemotaxis protein/HPt (histidine-containing phosphotransfer) domain-containing protein
VELRRAAAAGEPYPLVLVDAAMPEVDGFGLAAQIRSHPELAGATILMMLATDRQRSVERCREVGVQAYLMKPPKQSELLNTILDIMSTPTVPARAARGAERVPVGARPSERAPTGTLRALRVLLAEDNPVNQRLAAVLLAKWGYPVMVAGNGKEALAALEREPFDLVLMDLEMPEMGGFEATARIRAREQGTGRHIPVIALTAHAMKGDRQRCLEAGMDDYVAKPIQAQELLRAIEARFPDTSRAPAVWPEEAPAEKVFNADVALERVGGDRELLKDLAGVFLSESPTMMTEVREAVAQRDALRLKRAAHTLKGAAGTFGAVPSVAAAQRLETMAREGDLTGAEEGWSALEEAVARLRPALAELRDGKIP